MGFLKDFFMRHPIISILAGLVLLDRAEEAVMVHHAHKNGTVYYGRRYRVNVPYQQNKTTEAKEEEE